MPVAGAAFERPERVLDDGAAAAHRCGGRGHSCGMPVEDVLVLPALDGAGCRLGGQAALAQRTGVAIGLAAGVADFEPPAIGLAPRARDQELACRTAIDLVFGIVDERLVAEAALRVEPPGAPGLRHIGEDAVLLAGLEFGPLK